MQSNLNWTYLQHALAAWRKRNPWADGIEFARFPEKYRAEIETAAHINQHREG